MKKILIIYGANLTPVRNYIYSRPNYLFLDGKKITGHSSIVMLKTIYKRYCDNVFFKPTTFIHLHEVPVHKMEFVILSLMNYHRVKPLPPLVITVCCSEFELPSGDSYSSRYEVVNVADIDDVTHWFTSIPNPEQ